MTAQTYSLTMSNALLLEKLVTPAVQELMRVDEVRGVSVRRRRGGDIVTVIDTVAEPLELLLWYEGSDETLDETAARVRSDLQDSLAESSFAWGELRG